MNNQNSYVSRFNGYALPNYYSYGQMNPQQVNYPTPYNSGYGGQISNPQPVSNVSEIPIQQIRYLRADEVKGFALLPNEKVMLIDRENKMVYIKSADSLGESFIDAYKYEKADTEQKPEEKVEYLRKEDLGNFLTKDDLKAFSNKLDKLEAKINLGNLLAKDKEEE